MSLEEVRQMVHMKALTSKIDPGEAVGAICAQVGVVGWMGQGCGGLDRAGVSWVGWGRGVIG